MVTLPTPVPAIEIALFSQGMSKGLRQTDGAQFLVRPEIAEGPVFLGGYFKNITATNADGEAAVMAGLRGRVQGFSLTASAAFKWNTGTRGPLDREALELNAAVERHFGRITPRVSLTWSPDDLGGTRASLYTEGGVTIGPFAGFSLSSAVSRRSRAGNPDYTAFNAGVSYAFARHFSVDLRYYDTDRSALGVIYRGRVVAAARLRF